MTDDRRTPSVDDTADDMTYTTDVGGYTSGDSYGTAESGSGAGRSGYGTESSYGTGQSGLGTEQSEYGTAAGYGTAETGYTTDDTSSYMSSDTTAAMTSDAESGYGTGDTAGYMSGQSSGEMSGGAGAYAASGGVGEMSSDVDEASGGEDAAALEAEIARTREELTGTVVAIGDRLAPSSILDGAKQTVRDATVGKVENMTSTASEALSGAGSKVQDAGAKVQETGGGIFETIKQNPIPAALTGVGVAWLFKNRSSGSSSKSSYSQYSSNIGAGSGSQWDRGFNSGSGPVTDWSSQGGSTEWASQGGTTDWSSQGGSSGGIGDKVGDVGSKVGETVGGVGSKVGDVADTVGRKVSDVGQTVGSVPQQVGSSGVGQQAQRLLDESPLAVGAVALAVGAAIGMALPVTQVERRVLGPTAGKVVGQVETTATDALQKAQDKVEQSTQS